MSRLSLAGFCTVAFSLWLAVAARGQAVGEVNVSSPVDRYCRIGAFMPIAISWSGAGEAEIELDGALPVRITAGTGAGTVQKVIVPVLVVNRPAETVRLRASGTDRVVTIPWRILGDDERLIGIVGSGKAKGLEFLFPGKTIVVVHLDALRPLEGNKGAWEVLDAIVCDAGPIPGVDDAAIRALLANGTALVVKATDGRTAPASLDERWPWERQGDWWILRHEPFGPRGVISQAADAPVRGWWPDVSTQTRIRLVALVAAIAIVLAAVRFLRKPRRIAGAIAITSALLVMLALWSGRSPKQREVQGVVASYSGGFLQHDFWTYVSQPSRHTGPVSCDCILDNRQPRANWTHFPTRPILTSANQAVRQKLTLQVSSSGDPVRWTAQLQANEKAVFLTRVVDPFRELHPVYYVVDSPMQRVVREAYLAPGVHILGQGHPREDQGFAEVFLRREP